MSFLLSQDQVNQFLAKNGDIADAIQQIQAGVNPLYTVVGAPSQGIMRQASGIDGVTDGDYILVSQAANKNWNFVDTVGTQVDNSTSAGAINAPSFQSPDSDLTSSILSTVGNDLTAVEGAVASPFKSVGQTAQNALDAIKNAAGATSTLAAWLPYIIVGALAIVAVVLLVLSSGTSKGLAHAVVTV